ncbi:VOC family protein [Grimontia kaedaensis]|uniref:VOC family protein n=1 Tax=Grimontia kaedaensis TaxID=2872157 RepID=A0ABY4WUX1_9GAMM|nr:VOC family protein [Grimontia kaedaensis]USH03383.1 VOC family protein [Grimontia kaedaensis]
MPALTVDSLYATLPDFSARLDALLEVLELDLSAYRADHIALRINDRKAAEELHQSWLSSGEELSVNNINGRPIVVIKANDPLSFGQWQTQCVELPYPGDKLYPVEGWEHAEWVVPSKATTPEALLEDVFGLFPALAAKWDQLASLGVKVKLSSPAGEGERIANPTVAFKFKGICVKLHPVTLEQVIESEKGA